MDFSYIDIIFLPSLIKRYTCVGKLRHNESKISQIEYSRWGYTASTARPHFSIATWHETTTVHLLRVTDFSVKNYWCFYCMKWKSHSEYEFISPNGLVFANELIQRGVFRILSRSRFLHRHHLHILDTKLWAPRAWVTCCCPCGIFIS